MQTQTGICRGAYILTPLRTAKGRELRKQGREVFANRYLSPREDGCSNTVTTVLKDNLLLEPRKRLIPINTDKDGNAKTVLAGYHKFYAASLLKFGASGTFIATTTMQQQESTTEIDSGAQWRIRKLTPRECYRLMDFSDEDIDKMLAATYQRGGKTLPVPKGAHYKAAGNSICKGVLYHIFKAMFVDEPPKMQPKQLSLFDNF